MPQMRCTTSWSGALNEKIFDSEKSHAFHIAGMDLEKITHRVSELIRIQSKDVWAAGKQQRTVNARSLFCYWAVRKLGVSMASLSRRLKISIPAINKSVVRGK